MKTTAHRHYCKGFSLVEVTMSLAIVSFCLTVLIGLTLVGLSTNKTSVSQTSANSILSSVASDLRATPTTSGQSPLYAIPIPANPVTASPTPTTLYVTSDGEVSANPHTASTYLLTVSFPIPASSGTASGAGSRAATLVDLKISWPAATTSTMAAGSIETFLALDRN